MEIAAAEPTLSNLLNDENHILECNRKACINRGRACVCVEKLL